MREFHNPGKIFGSFFGTPKARARLPGASELAANLTSVTKDGDEPARKKRARGISSQRSTLLTAGSAVGQETQRKSLLGVS